MSYLGYEDFEVGHDEFGVVTSDIRPFLSKEQSKRLTAKVKLKEPELRKSVDILLGPLFEGRPLTNADKDQLRTMWVASDKPIKEKKAQARARADQLAKKNAGLVAPSPTGGHILLPGQVPQAPPKQGGWTQGLVTQVPATRKAGYAGAALGALGVGWAGSAVAADFDAPTWTGVLIGALAGATAGYFTGAGVFERFHEKKVGDAFGADAKAAYDQAKSKVKHWKKKLKKFNKNKFKSGPLKGKVKDPLGRDIAQAKVKEWEGKLEQAKAAGGGPKPKAGPAEDLAAALPVAVQTKVAPKLPEHAYTFDLQQQPPPVQSAQQATGWFATPMVGDSGPSRGVVIGSVVGLATAAGLGSWWWSSRRT